jgi:predicted acylesterase/phospholipase RssA
MTDTPKSTLHDQQMPQHNASDGNDAVCFCAGISGAYFGAGVIHAYLASRRRPPKVAAGISAGALSAAAMQKCYAELDDEQSQGGACDCASDKKQRWAWFRTYIHALTDNPFAMFWDAIPDISDFFADMPPIKDTSLPWGEAAARRQRYILIKLGRWFAALDVRVRTIAETVVYYVRYKEGYGATRFSQCLRYYSRFIYLIIRLCFAIAKPTREMWFKKYLFEEAGYSGKKRSIRRFFNIRPLFGWLIYCVATAVVLLCATLVLAALSWTAFGVLSTNLLTTPNLYVLIVSLLIAAGLHWALLRKLLDVELFPAQSTGRQHLITMLFLLPFVLILAGILGSLICLRIGCSGQVPFVDGWNQDAKSLKYVLKATVVIIIGALVVGFVYVRWRKRHGKDEGLKEAFLQLLAHEIGIKQELITDFYLLLKLRRLFDPESLSPDKAGRVDPIENVRPVGGEPMALVLAAAPLQTVRRDGTAVPAQQLWARENTKLIEALQAALALPGLTRPVVTRSTNDWGHGDQQKLSLVDGSVIRANPIPALFDFLHTEAEKKGLRNSLETDHERDCRLHVVYAVPTTARKLTPGDEIKFKGDIVDVALLSMRLARRRDISMEMEQTRFISKVEKLARPNSGPVNLANGSRDSCFKIFPDAIAPETDISLGEPLKPDHDKCLEVMAAGCRQTLRTLYAADMPVYCKAITCRMLFAKLWKVDAVRERPGVDEICSKCNGRLTSPEPPPKTRLELDGKHFTRLTGRQPRIVFVASGGVFRGSFQAGILAALVRADIKVDLIVGASVGTLLGSVLGSAQCRKDDDRYVPIYQLVQLFAHADEKIALTSTLKSAMREIGIRGRSINLSPREVQRMMQRGSRFDPGFAAVGAPPALLDAISTLLVVPFNSTKEVAASITSGEIAKSVGDLLKCVREHTLSRLGIEKFLMGVSLLEPEARKLLYSSTLDLNCPQPFLNAGKAAFFATTTNLLTWESKLLGDPGAFDGSYNFVEAALSSSAFPAVFQPRLEADVYPGLGSEAVVYADGGMFDNVPFLPALRILSAVQRSHAKNEKMNNAEVLKFLKDRFRNPDLIIGGSLNVNPEDDDNQGTFDNLIAVYKRAKILDSNVKIRDFEAMSAVVHRQLEWLLKNHENAADKLSDEDIDFINGIVDGAVLPVYPSSAKHLNGTFAFCRTLGLENERIFFSVADGCYQTFAAFAMAQDPRGVSKDGQLAAESIKALKYAGKVSMIERIQEPKLKRSEGDGDCPFFKIKGNEFVCPFKAEESEKFAEAAGVYDACVKDVAHGS